MTARDERFRSSRAAPIRQRARPLPVVATFTAASASGATTAGPSTFFATSPFAASAAPFTASAAGPFVAAGADFTPEVVVIAAAVGVFPPGSFVTTTFVATGRLTTGFIPATFFATPFVPASLITAAFVATTFLTAALFTTPFVAATFLPTPLFTASFVATAFFPAPLFAASLLTVAATFAPAAFVAPAFTATTFFTATFVATASASAPSAAPPGPATTARLAESADQHRDCLFPGRNVPRGELRRRQIGLSLSWLLGVRDRPRPRRTGRTLVSIPGRAFTAGPLFAATRLIATSPTGRSPAGRFVEADTEVASLFLFRLGGGRSLRRRLFAELEIVVCLDRRGSAGRLFFFLIAAATATTAAAPSTAGTIVRFFPLAAGRRSGFPLFLEVSRLGSPPGLFELQSTAEGIVVDRSSPGLLGPRCPVFLFPARPARTSFTALFAPLATRAPLFAGFLAPAAFAARSRTFPFTTRRGAFPLAPGSRTLLVAGRTIPFFVARTATRFRALFPGGQLIPQFDFFAGSASDSLFPVAARFARRPFAPTRLSRTFAIRPAATAAIPVSPPATSPSRIPIAAFFASRRSGPEFADVRTRLVTAAIRRGAPVPAFQRVPELVLGSRSCGGRRSGFTGGLGLRDRFRLGSTPRRRFEDRFDPSPLGRGFVDLVEQARSETIIKEIVVVLVILRRHGGGGRGGGFRTSGGRSSRGRRGRRIEIAEIQPFKVQRVADRPLRIEVDPQEVGGLGAQRLIRVVAR